MSNKDNQNQQVLITKEEISKLFGCMDNDNVFTPEKIENMNPENRMLFRRFYVILQHAFADDEFNLNDMIKDTEQYVDSVDIDKHITMEEFFLAKKASRK